MGKVVLGLDGGGTKTLTVCVDKDRKVLGQFSSACSNHNSVGPELARLAIHAGILGAISAAGCIADDGMCFTAYHSYSLIYDPFFISFLSRFNLGQASFLLDVLMTVFFFFSPFSLSPTTSWTLGSSATQQF
jgi:hypothetical protein